MITKGLMEFRERVLTILAVALIGAVPSLFAKGVPVKIGSNTSLSLPAGWTIVESCQDDTPPQHVSSSLDLKAATLLLAAHPADPARRVGFSLFRTNFHSMGPSPLMAGEMGAQAEAEKLLCMVLSLGFTPTATQTARSNSSQNTPLLTIEVTAKNAAGEERVFSDTAAGKISPIVRLFSSRPADDAASAQEIASIIQSLGVTDAKSDRSAQTGSNSTQSSTSESSVKSNPAQTAPADISPETAQMISKHHDALLMVEGQNGVGSGFLCTLGGRSVAITNAHVINGNPGFKLTDLKSTVLNVKAGAISVDHDVVRLEVDSERKSFEVMENLDADVKIGDPVMVLGNAEGARVVRPVEGKVVGIGPNLVEVDAPFVPGNSGSPIVHQATGKVLGVATYLIERKVSNDGKNSVVVETRRFGYRLDSIKAWEPINWQRFYAQSAQVKKIETLSNDFIQLYKDSHKQGQFESGNYESSVIQRIVQDFSTTLGQHERTMSAADKKTLVLRFLADLRHASRGDIMGFDSRNAYDYFRREVEKQTKFRDSIYNDMTRAIEEKTF